MALGGARVVDAPKHIEQIGSKLVQKEEFLALLPRLEDPLLADAVDVHIEGFRVHFEVDEISCNAFQRVQVISLLVRVNVANGRTGAQDHHFRGLDRRLVELRQMLLLESALDVDVLAQVLLNARVEVGARVFGFRGERVSAGRFVKGTRLSVDVVGADQGGLLALLPDAYRARLVVEEDLV